MISKGEKSLELEPERVAPRTSPVPHRCHHSLFPLKTVGSLSLAPVPYSVRSELSLSLLVHPGPRRLLLVARLLGGRASAQSRGRCHIAPLDSTVPWLLRRGPHWTHRTWSASVL